MINAIQGKSIFGAPEESIFSSTDIADKTPNLVRDHPRHPNKQAASDNKRIFNKSMQRVISTTESNPIFGEFLHQPFWMNQSQVIYETNHSQNQF